MGGDLEFKIDEWTFLKVSPVKEVMRFGKKGKFIPRYVGPYRILKKVGNVAYELKFPAELTIVHPVFHFFLLMKCGDDKISIVPVKSATVKDRLIYKEVQLRFLTARVIG